MPVSLPRFIKKAFATDGLKTAIPDASNNATGRAGYDQGFPPINMQPKEAGGIPPRGEDMNGVIYDVTLAISYIQSGKSFPFNQDFATAIGGYSQGAVVSDASNATLWINGTANNTSFPAGWTNFSFSDPTESVRGTPFVATQTEVNSGFDDSKFVTPKKLKFGFAASFAANGFVKLPDFLGGVMIQWMKISFNTFNNDDGQYKSGVVSWVTNWPVAPWSASLTHIGATSLNTTAAFDQGYFVSSGFRIRTPYTLGPAAWMIIAIGR